MTVSDPALQGRRPRGRLGWLLPALFVPLTLLLTWPVVAHLGDRLPGTATWAFDESTFAWNIWYFKHALIDLHSSPLHSQLIWYPLGIDLILYTYNFFNALVGLPLLLATSVPVATNMTLLLATVLSGLGTYLLALYVLRSYDEPRNPAGAGRPRVPIHVARLAALLAGIIYAFGSNRAVYAALGHYDMVTTQWLPFYALYLLKTLHGERRRYAVMTGLFFAFAALAEMIFASFLALFSLILVIAEWHRVLARRQALMRLALAAFVALLIWSPVLVPIAREFMTGDYALEGWGESLKLSADVAGWVTPTDLNPLLAPPPSNSTVEANPAGDHWERELRAVTEGTGRFGDINTVYLGWATLLLAILGAWQGRRLARGWIWAALVFGILTLGPLLQIFGRYRFALGGLLPEGITFPLPFILLHFIPFINANRAPNRNSVILMLALAVLASYGAAWLVGKFYRHRGAGKARRPVRAVVYGLSGLLAVALIVEHLAVPLPTTDARVPAVYEKIATEPGDFAVMQLPLGWRNSFGVFGSERTQLQYYQTLHGKPIIGGNISRAPAFKLDYFKRIPLFQALTGLEFYQEPSPEMDAAARAQANALMALYDVRYLITYPPIPGGYPYQDTWQRTQAYTLDVLPVEKTPFWQEGEVRAYRVTPAPVSFPFRLDLAQKDSGPYLGQGWDYGQSGEEPYGTPARWATSTGSELILPLNAPTDATLRLKLAPLTYAGAPTQTLDISVNGTPVFGPSPLAAGWQDVTARIPSAATRRGPNRVSLHFGHAESPRLVFPDGASRAVIGSTGVASPANLEAHAFGEAFISAFMADGREIKASEGRRGYNVAVFDARDGELVETRAFDTTANEYESERLAGYLAQLPAGRIVVAATKGDAAAHLTDSAVAALRGIGSGHSTPASLAGKAHAIIGVKGAVPGSAVEVTAPDDAFVRVGGDYRTLAVAVASAEIGP